MAFGWKPRVEGLTWESLTPGDVLVCQKDVNEAIAYLILDGHIGNDHRALSLHSATITRVRSDDGLIGPELWEVFRASR